MNLINFHNYEKNKLHVVEVPVIHENQGNYENYFVAILGSYNNIYNFVVRDDKEQFNIQIKEKRINEWTIKEGCTGSQRGKYYLRNELQFCAIGQIIETNKYVYLTYKSSYGSTEFNKLIVNNNKQVDVIDITVTNINNTKIVPLYDLDKNIIFTRQFYTNHREDDSNFAKLRDKILFCEHLDYDSNYDSN